MVRCTAQLPPPLPRRLRACARVAVLTLVVVAVAGCGWFPVNLDPDSYSGSDQVFFHDLDEVNPDRTVNYTIDVGSSPRDVYLVLTNPTSSEIASPVIENRSVSAAARSVEQPAMTEGERAVAASMIRDKPFALRDNPEIMGWEAQPPSRLSSRSAAPPPSYAAVPGPGGYVSGTPSSGQYSEYDPATNTGTYDFYYDSTTNTIPAVLATRVAGVTTDFGPKTLEIWVQGSEWTTNVTSTMTTALADAFLSDGGTNDDIYDWLSNVFGEEWSAEAGAYANLIDETDTITILLYPIPYQGQTGPGGIVGFFWGKDNYLRSDYAYSNERVMFYIDSETFREPDVPNAWDITDNYPNLIVSTLGHEFQHMIDFHQQGILLDLRTQTWLNEMKSLVAEDLIEQRRQRRGPRGIAPPDPYDEAAWGTAGAPAISDGQIPLYNLKNDISLTNWGSTNDVLESYAIAYSFGAYLGRNFGGAELFAQLGQSTFSSPSSAIADSIASSGGSGGMTLEQLLWRWGAAVLLSDDTSQGAPFRMNAGAWVDSVASGHTYRLGSINHYYYDYSATNQSPDPPYVHTGDLGSSELAAGSKMLYRVGTGLTGSVELAIDFSEGMDFAVVVK